MHPTEITNARRFNARDLNPDAAGARDVAVEHRRLPAGFIDLTETKLARLDLLPTDGQRVGVRAGSAAAREVIAALADLPDAVPLHMVFNTGLDSQMFRACVTLLRHGVVSEQAFAAQCTGHFDHVGRDTPGLASHVLAAMGFDEAEPAFPERSMSLAERFAALEAAGLSPTREDDMGLTAAHHAAANDNLEALEVLKAAGVDLCAPNSAGVTPLHWAAANRAQRGLDYLLNLPNAPVNAPDRDGCTALHRALSHPGGEHDHQIFGAVVQRLLDAGANARALDHENLTPLGRATAYGRPWQILAVREHGLHEALYESTPSLLATALNTGNTGTAMTWFLGHPAEDQHTLLLDLAQHPYCRHTTLRALAGIRGVDLDMRDARNRTPIDRLVEKAGELAAIESPSAAFPECIAALRLSRAGAALSTSDRKKIIRTVTRADMIRTNSRDPRKFVDTLVKEGLITQSDPHVQAEYDESLGAIERDPDFKPGGFFCDWRHIKSGIGTGHQLDAANMNRVVALARRFKDTDFLKSLKKRGVAVGEMPSSNRVTRVASAAPVALVVPVAPVAPAAQPPQAAPQPRTRKLVGAIRRLISRSPRGPTE